MTTTLNTVENRSGRRLTLSLTDLDGSPVGESVVVKARGRRSFPDYPLVVGQVYNLTGRYTGLSTPGDFNFAMVEGNVIVARYTQEGPIYTLGHAGPARA